MASAACAAVPLLGWPLLGWPDPDRGQGHSGKHQINAVKDGLAVPVGYEQALANRESPKTPWRNRRARQTSRPVRTGG
ncbi:MAG: hypothetical protein GYA20_12450 [Chloroflexi bacterium]|nr:hypothetical protein [Chloroflexota bacterium]